MSGPSILLFRTRQLIRRPSLLPVLMQEASGNEVMKHLRQVGGVLLADFLETPVRDGPFEIRRDEGLHFETVAAG